MAITNLRNPKVKLAARLRQRRDREREGLMLVEGGAELRLAALRLADSAARS